MRGITGVVLDLCCVTAFVAIGRSSHAEGLTAAGLASTAWPFLAGAAAGWVVARAWRRPAALAPPGLVVWMATVGIGMAVRVLAGQGTAATFIAVAAAFLGLTMLGWRAIAKLGTRSTRPGEPVPEPERRGARSRTAPRSS